MAGHAVERIAVAELDFPLLRTREDFHRAEAPPAIRRCQDAIGRADHLVILYPPWHGTMPALLKGFFEQVFRPGFALEYGERFPRKLLQGKSARIVVTISMPALIYRWYFGAHHLKGLERYVLKFVGITPVRENLFGLVEAASPAKRAKWLAAMRGLERRAR